MKNRTNLNLILISLMFFVIATNRTVQSNSSGYTGRTLKSSNLGCGSCHGQNPVSEVMASIIGPDTVTANQTNMFFLTITKLSKTGAGLDIATKNGSLSPVSNNIHLSNGELTHSTNIPMTNGTVTIQFNYTAPGMPGMDTIWATGLASNSDGTSSGDNWNWGMSKKVIVRNVTGIIRTSGHNPDKFVLNQNYPNPFNPVTTINFSLPVSSSVKLMIFNILGERIGAGLDENLNAGEYEFKWDAGNEASGIYFYRIVTPQFSETRRMNLIK